MLSALIQMAQSPRGSSYDFPANCVRGSWQPSLKNVWAEPVLTLVTSTITNTATTVNQHTIFAVNHSIGSRGRKVG